MAEGKPSPSPTVPQSTPSVPIDASSPTVSTPSILPTAPPSTQKPHHTPSPTHSHHPSRKPFQPTTSSPSTKESVAKGEILDVLVGHNTWDDFQLAGPRIFKHYSLPLITGFEVPKQQPDLRRNRHNETEIDDDGGGGDEVGDRQDTTSAEETSKKRNKR